MLKRQLGWSLGWNNHGRPTGPAAFGSALPEIEGATEREAPWFPMFSERSSHAKCHGELFHVLHIPYALCMVYLATKLCLIFGVNVGKYSIHGAFGYWNRCRFIAHGLMSGNESTGFTVVLKRGFLQILLSSKSRCNCLKHHVQSFS